MVPFTPLVVPPLDLTIQRRIVIIIKNRGYSKMDDEKILEKDYGYGPVSLPGVWVDVAHEFCRNQVNFKRNVLAGRLFLAALKQITQDDFPKAHVSIADLKLPRFKVAGISKACDDLLDSKMFKNFYKNIDFKDPERKELNNPKREKTAKRGTNLFTEYFYDMEKQTVDIAFNPNLKPLFLGLQEFFARINYFDFLQVKSYYSQRLAFFLKSHESQGKVPIPIEQLYDLVDATPDMRNDYTQFRRNCLLQAQRELQKIIPFEFDAVRPRLGRGGKVTGIIFRFTALSPPKRKYIKGEDYVAPAHRAKPTLKNEQDIQAFIKACRAAGGCNTMKHKPASPECKTCGWTPQGELNFEKGKP